MCAQFFRPHPHFFRLANSKVTEYPSDYVYNDVVFQGCVHKVSRGNNNNNNKLISLVFSELLIDDSQIYLEVGHKPKKN